MLSALQQQQIMMLECMIAAYTFSALTLEGARSSERQMMASGSVNESHTCLMMDTQTY